MGDLSSILSTSLDVASNPFLPEIVCRIEQLKAISAGQAPALCVPTPDGTVDDIGVGNLLPPLRAYVYAQQNKWVYFAAAAAVFGIPFFLGMAIGKEQG